VSNVTEGFSGMFYGTNALSDYIKCAIHTSFATNENWSYDWDQFCFIPETIEELQIAVDLWENDNQNALETYGPINEWQVSAVTNMSGLFENKTEFNDQISNWDVSNVTNMMDMFYKASSFNQDISNWDVSNVINMERMFGRASNFNQDISSWDVSNTTNMRSMFMYASNFNQELSTWIVSGVQDMGFMFMGCDSFNSNISNWDVTGVVDMTALFENATTFNQDLTIWNTVNVIGMSSMFKNAHSFNQNLSGWDVSNALHMSDMFNNAGLSDENKCEIQTSFSTNEHWPYDWSESCNLKINTDLNVPDIFSLHQNYPNPFNPTTTINYDLPDNAHVSLAIYDLMGKKVITLIDEPKTAGRRSVQWNATNNKGESVSAGMFIYNIQAGQFTHTKKMVLLK